MTILIIKAIKERKKSISESVLFYLLLQHGQMSKAYKLKLVAICNCSLG